MPQAPLQSKERSLFSGLVKFYETKQYKKGLKNADQILRKVPNHGDTQAMKALILNSQGHSDDAFPLAKEALKNDMKSHVCWHVYGLLYRSAKNYEESIKAYKFALRLEPESRQIQRDLALLQMQMRDYQGYVQSRRAMLQQQPAARSNWTALAIAQHLSGDLEGAERTLTLYEDSLRTPPAATDIEHQEAALYKNMVIAEMGQTQKALDHLEAVARSNYDRQWILETRAAYLLKLGRKDEAEKIYRALVDRNPENRLYYQQLIGVLGIDEGNAEGLHKVYAQYAEKNPRSDAPQRVPLDFLQGDAFRTAADRYLQRMLNKGVPSTFANIKSLYSNEDKKKTIQDLVESYRSGDFTPAPNSTPEKAEDKEKAKSQFDAAVLYFLAQHYDYHKSRDLAKATSIITEALEKSPESVECHMTKARILKHEGKLHAAAEAMEAARALDTKDRYICSKAAKYQLRDDANAAALTNMSKFTRNEAVGGALGDLVDMQCVWFLSEDGESFLRQSQLGLALKRFATVYAIFDVWQEDQFDFHSYSVRKGQIRAYLELVRFEDRLRDHPYYTRAAVGAAKAYILLHAHPALARGPDALVNGVNGEAAGGGAGDGASAAADKAAKKKAARKARREREKLEEAEAAKKDARGGKQPTGPDGEPKKEDKDPDGKALLEVEDPLKEASRYLQPVLEMSPKNALGQQVGFELYLRRKKLPLALRCLISLRSLQAPEAVTHSYALRLANALLLASTSSSSDSALPPTLAKTLDEQLRPCLPSSLPQKYAAADLAKANDKYIADHASDPLAVIMGWECKLDLASGDEAKLKETRKQASEALAKNLSGGKDVVIKNAEHAVGMCRLWGVDPLPIIEAAGKRWEGTDCIRRGRA